ncbi:hypothetical protein LINPERPRIM_LOCUS20012, partial [Linum perenne]
LSWGAFLDSIDKKSEREIASKAVDCFHDHSFFVQFICCSH